MDGTRGTNYVKRKRIEVKGAYGLPEGEMEAILSTIAYQKCLRKAMKYVTLHVTANK
jgi:hypothetical protein